MSSRSLGSRDSHSPERTTGEGRTTKSVFSRRSSRDSRGSVDGSIIESAVGDKLPSERRRRSRSETVGFKNNHSSAYDGGGKILPYSNLSGAMK